MEKVKSAARILGGMVLTLFLISSIVACDESAPKEPTPTPGPTATPTPPPSVSYEFLLAEREVNATRFDAIYKDKYVELEGVVAGIDDGNIKIEGPSGFLDEGIIEDVSQEDQMQLDKGMRLKLVCKVGNYIMGQCTLTAAQVLPSSMPWPKVPQE